MTNMHSRQTQSNFENDENVLCYDKLILKLEEVDSDSGRVLTSCYVAYDHAEAEYYVCGKKSGNMGWEDFKFYCKKKKHMMDFLKYMIGDLNITGAPRVNHILYNYKNLDLNGEEEHRKDFIDYYVLAEQEDETSELAGYNEMRFNKRWLLPLLKMLKNIRY